MGALAEIEREAVHTGSIYVFAVWNWLRKRQPCVSSSDLVRSPGRHESAQARRLGATSADLTRFFFRRNPSTAWQMELITDGIARRLFQSDQPASKQSFDPPEVVADSRFILVQLT